MNRPYNWFLSRHSAAFGKTILSEGSEIVHKLTIPMMHFIAHGVLIIALPTLLTVIDLKFVLIVGLPLVTAYAFIFKAPRGFLARIGQERCITIRRY